MNKLIVKLYDQAIILEGNGDYVTGELDPFKFAELIVLECAKLVDQEWNLSGAELREHFGVEK